MKREACRAQTRSTFIMGNPLVGTRWPRGLLRAKGKPPRKGEPRARAGWRTRARSSRGLVGDLVEDLAEQPDADLDEGAEGDRGVAVGRGRRAVDHVLE